MTTTAEKEPASSKAREIEGVLQELLAIRSEIHSDALASESLLDAVHPDFRESARNLLHYLALRRRDLRPLQLRLADLGLSSLGRAESHVLATVEAVLTALHGLAYLASEPPVHDPGVLDFARGQRLLEEHTEALVGPATPDREVRIMVTMPSEAAEDYTLIHDLLQNGMDCMRINCAHDDPTVWSRMIEHLRRAESALGRSCRVVIDLGGPKLRTGPIAPGPAVARVRPGRDLYGRVVTPARVWLTDAQDRCAPPTEVDALLPVDREWLGTLRAGDRLRFRDARGAARSVTVVDVSERGCWGEVRQTAYIVPGTTLRRESKEGECVSNDEAVVVDLPPLEGVLALEPGDMLVVTRQPEPGRPASHDSAGRVLTPATVGCTIPEVFDDVRSGESIWFDDGKIGGIIERVESDRIRVRITQTRLGGEKLRGDKGINLPESRLRLAALTAKDLEDLPFVAENADVVELSFANSASDVEQLQRELARLTSTPPAIVLKIETQRSFANLPEMLLTAMRSPNCGVMIARGDLAVECGFERLAEVQEEILWICEAAHVPVIWATQVLESLAKQGMPSRAEVTDAAMGHRAECVMLNKGPHILTALRVLDNILRRMRAHQTKKSAMLRELRLAHALSPETESDPGEAT